MNARMAPSEKEVHGLSAQELLDRFQSAVSDGREWDCCEEIQVLKKEMMRRLKIKPTPGKT